MKLPAMALLGLTLATTQATGGATCVPDPDRVRAWLLSKHHERLVGNGLSSTGGVIFEVYVSSAGTWTILATAPGVTCFKASGRHWHTTDRTVGQRGSGAPI